MDIVGKAKDAPDGRGRRRDTGTGADTDSAPLKRVLGRTPNSPTVSQGYMEDDLIEIDLKSLFRAFSSLENWIMI